MTPIQNKILEEKQKILPIDVGAIAAALGLNVFLSGFSGANVSGQIIKDADVYSIYINKEHSLQRQRFTLAHEIAHFLLHKEYIGDGIFEDAMYRSTLSNFMEVEANKLAADILMPANKVQEKINEYYETHEDGLEIVNVLSSDFNVSKHSMAIRLDIPYFPAGDF